MRTKPVTFFFFFLVVIAAGIACQKEINIEEVPVKSWVKYTIDSGQHIADLNPVTPVSYDELRFMVKFDSSAIYTTLDTANQRDINKLYGFSDNNEHHHKNSARFGWRWLDNELHLLIYQYNDSMIIKEDLGRISIGAEHYCSIKVEGNKYIYTVDNKTMASPRTSTTPKGAGYKLYPFFGGDEPAPHKISIWIKEL